MAEAARLPSSSGLRSRSQYKTLIGLLASTALALRAAGSTRLCNKADVIWKDWLSWPFRQTKFGKSPFVPVDDSTRRALARYAKTT